MLVPFFTLMLLSLHFSCDEPKAEIRGNPSSSKPGDPEEVLGYLDETVEVGGVQTFTVLNTTINIPSGSTSEAAQLQMRVLKSAPEREELTVLGNPKGDVVDVSFYRKRSQEIFSSNLFAHPYQLSQTLSNVDDPKLLKYVIITSPNTKSEKIQLISGESISKSVLALTATDLTASLELRITQAIIFAVESEFVPDNITAINFPQSIQIDGGATISGLDGEISRPDQPAEVNDGTSSSSLVSSPPITWIASSSEGVTSYEVAIGSAKKLSDIQAWTDVGLVTSTTISGLNLVAGRTYFASIRALSSSGISQAAAGDGWTVLAAGADCSGLVGGAWIPVPANPVVGQDDNFCVMKYEARILGSENDALGNQAYNIAWIPESRPTGTPWIDISQQQASAECASLNEVDPGKGYTLITNEMWQTIARNIETAQNEEGNYLNWSDGVIAGSSTINRGHSDRDPDYSCASIVDNVAGDCASSDEWAESTQKRTHTLSNFLTIWDFAGNVWEWNSSNLEMQGEDGSIAQKKWDGSQSLLEDENAKLRWGPTQSYYNNDSATYRKSGYAGFGYGFLSYSGGAVFRGGSWADQSESGIFAAYLGHNSSNSPSQYDVGFRCAATAL